MKTININQAGVFLGMKSVAGRMIGADGNSITSI